MKANSSGNRYSGSAHNYRHVGEEVDDRAAAANDPVSPRTGEARTYQRELFVYHQQDLARRALHLGSPGAARAALRALHGEDFHDARRAVEHLRALRDPASPQDEVMHALRVLIQLVPVRDDSLRSRVATEEMEPLGRDGLPLGDD